MYNIDLMKEMREEQKKLQACKTKKDLNHFFTGKEIMVCNNSDWNNEVCFFVEMVGEGSRENWKLKVKTRFNTFLELSASESLILAHRIKTTEKEAEVIKSHLENKYGRGKV